MVVLGVVVYYSATSALNTQLQDRIAAEVEDLRDIYISGGSSALSHAITTRLHLRSNHGLEYAFYERDGKLIAGSLPASLPHVGWSKVNAPPDGDEEPGEQEYLSVLTVPLPKGKWLVVGDDLNRVDELGEAILRSLGWALGLTITLAILGGTLLSGLFLRRIDNMTRAAEAIISGDLGRRLSTRGTNDDLDRLAATLNRMLDRISMLMETTQQITNDIAHDMRTPLGHLRQSLDQARNSAADVEDLKEILAQAIEDADAILETFAALLRIAQIEAGSRTSHFRTVDFSQLVESIVQTFAPSVEDAGKSLSAHVEPGISIKGDRELLTQMIVNLIENALVHTPAGTRIRVELRGDPQFSFSISDNGPGIPSPEREKVFRRFYRLEQSRTSPGNGLGLALVAAIAGVHNLSIAVEDNEPGLRMTLHLPIGSKTAEPVGAMG